MPFAFDTGRLMSDEQAKRRVASNQAILRRVNEAIRRGHSGDPAVVRCECGQLGCNLLITLTEGEYGAVRAHPRRFAVVPAHAVVEIETTVERHDRYAVVETHDPAATAIAERTAPRPSAEG
jgi:hypothetical protein